MNTVTIGREDSNVANATTFVPKRKTVSGMILFATAKVEKSNGLSMQYNCN